MVFRELGWRGVEETGSVFTARPQRTGGYSGVQRLQTGRNAEWLFSMWCLGNSHHPTQNFEPWPQRVAVFPRVCGCVRFQQLCKITAETDPKNPYPLESFV